MTVREPNTWDALLRRLDRFGAFDDHDRTAVRAMPFRIERVRANRYLVREGERASECCLLISGYACRHKLTSSGGRQILSFQLAGEILDLQHLLLGCADHNIQTITAATIAWVPTVHVHHLARQRPVVGDALWRDTLIEASISREKVVSVGRRDAIARVAHLLCEFSVRAHEAGLCGADRFELPMSQEQIADATGLTTVHVNRMLQMLDSEGLIAREKRRFRIVDAAQMQRIADFDPAYLHGAR